MAITYFAPNIEQSDCINHLEGTPDTNIKRNCLIESARVARGAIQDLNSVNVSDFDMAIFPGGYGAAKNLCSFATQGENFKINSFVKKFILDMNSQKKPLGFMCISPVIAAKLFPNVRCTLGLDQANLDKLTQIGATAVQANYDDVVIDTHYNVYSTPAYMIDTSISKIAIGIERLVTSICE